MGGPAYINGKKYRELNNHYRCNFELEGHDWSSSEQYFQSKKSDNEEYQKKIKACLNGHDAWRIGQEAPLRDDWEDVKVDIMYRANEAKFSQNENLKEILLSTSGPIKFMNSTQFWNEQNATILEKLRETLR